MGGIRGDVLAGASGWSGRGMGAVRRFGVEGWMGGAWRIAMELLVARYS